MAENETANDDIARTDAPESADRSVSSRKLVAEARKEARRVERAARRKTPASAPKRRLGGVRAVGTAAAVCALIAGVAIPAYAATQHDPEEVAAATVRDEAAQDAQSFEASDAAEGADVSATSYSARTADEISQIEAEREAVKRAKEAAEAAAKAKEAASQTYQTQGTPAGAGESQPEPTPAAPPVANGSWGAPLPAGSYTFGDGVGYTPGHYESFHSGQDLLAPGGTPIYAVQNCVVEIAQGPYYGYGNYVQLGCNVDGHQVTIKHGHMSQIFVYPGQQVSMGQQLGTVGSTGFSTATHLHIEVWIDGVVQQPRQVLPIG